MRRCADLIAFRDADTTVAGRAQDKRRFLGSTQWTELIGPILRVSFVRTTRYPLLLDSVRPHRYDHCVSYETAMATILVIDDEPSIRGLLKEVLEKAGHRVLQAEDGRKGLSLYQQEPVDLVIMDLLMPETDGLEATLQLTREYLDAKVIAITGAQGDQNFLDVAKLFGARRAFAKPFDITKLLEAVEEELAVA